MQQKHVLFGLHASVLEILEPMSNGVAVRGSLAPLVTEMESFLEVLPEGSVTIVVEPEKIPVCTIVRD